MAFATARSLALKGADVVLLPHANRTVEAADGSHAFDGREREAAPDELRRAQETLLADRPAPPRLHDVLARDNGVYAVFADQVGFDGHSTHVGGAYVLAPDGATAHRWSPHLARERRSSCNPTAGQRPRHRRPDSSPA